MPFTVIIVRLKGVLSNKLLKIYNPGHVIRGNGFLYLCIIEKESERFAGEGIAFYPCDHGKMGRYKIPQANAGLLCIVDHIFYMKDLIFDPIDYVSVRNLLISVVDGSHNIVLIP